MSIPPNTEITVEDKVENITLTIQEEQEEYPIISLMKAYDNLYELKYKYYDIYKYVYNVKNATRP